MIINEESMYKPLAIAALLSVTAQAWAQPVPERVVALDYAALDILDNLAQRERIAGVAQATLPDYLSDYADDAFTDVGTLKVADMEALESLSPDAILISGRLEAERENLEALAPVYAVATEGEDAWDQLEHRVDDLAALFDAQQAGEQALADLRQSLDQQLAEISGTPKVLVVVHNDGKLIVQHNAVVHDLMGLASPELPENVESVTRGERTFTPLTPAQIAATLPDLVWVVDRSAAIGQTPLDVEALTQAVGDDLAIAVGSPRLWYLAGQGLDSTRLQVEEVVAALAP